MLARKLVVTDYRGARDITVRFLDTGHIKDTRYEYVISGIVLDDTMFQSRITNKMILDELKVIRALIEG